MRTDPPFLYSGFVQLLILCAFFYLPPALALPIAKNCEEALSKLPKDQATQLSENYTVSQNFFAKDNKLSPSEQRAVELEARAAWEFLREYHLAVGGNPNVPFGIKGVEIRPISEAPFKREFSVQDGKIIIGMKKSLLGNFLSHTPQEIRDRWERGDQFPRLSVLKPDPMKKIWPYINPTGRARLHLKEIVKDLQTKAQIRIEGSNLENLRTLAHGKLDGKTDTEIENLRTHWIEAIKNEATVEGVLNAATHKIAHDQIPNYKLNLSSYGVNVGNLHDIDIGIKTGQEETVGPAERPTVEVNSKGSLVNVFTIDRIHIQLDLSGSVERHALERALSSLRGRTSPE